MTPRMTIRKSVLTVTAILMTSMQASLQPVWASESTFSNSTVSTSMHSTPTFEQLLNAYRKQQPLQKTLSGFRQLQSAQQAQAKSWIAGDVNVMVHHETDALTDDKDTQNWQVGAEFPVWLPSQKQGVSELAEVYQENLSIEQAYLNWLASGALRQLIWDYQTALAEVQIAEQTLQTSQQLFESIQTKVRLGESALMDSVLAEQTYLSHKTALIKQQSNLQVAKQAYQKWTGFTVLPKSIIETQVSDVSDVSANLDQHPEIVKSQSQLQVSNVQLRQITSQKSGQPKLYFGAKQDTLQNETDTSLVMEVMIPLGMDAGFGVKKAQQQLQVQQDQAQFEQVVQEIGLKQQQISQTLMQLQQSIELTNQQLKLAEQALDMSLKAYQLGEISVQNLLLIQQQAINAKRDAVLAQHQLGQTIAHYNQISGDILGATNR